MGRKGGKKGMERNGGVRDGVTSGGGCFQALRGMDTPVARTGSETILRAHQSFNRIKKSIGPALEENSGKENAR